jgi:hypothetical protein
MKAFASLHQRPERTPSPLAGEGWGGGSRRPFRSLVHSGPPIALCRGGSGREVAPAFPFLPPAFPFFALARGAEEPGPTPLPNPPPQGGRELEGEA